MNCPDRTFNPVLYERNYAAKKFHILVDEIHIEDVPLVGGKNASLGEMYQDLTSQGERSSCKKDGGHVSIAGTKKSGRHSGLCGQAPSDYPEFAEVPGKRRDRLHIYQPGLGREDHSESPGDGEGSRHVKSNSGDASHYKQ